MSMEKFVIAQRAMQDSALLSALGVRFDSMFYGDLEKRIGMKKNIIISVYGPQGAGKSFGAFYIAKKWQDFGGVFTSAGIKSGHVAFTNKELLDMFAGAGKKDIFVKDEQVQAFGVGSTRMEEGIENVAAVVRAQQISLIYCSPALQLHNVHYILESTGIISGKKNVCMHILCNGQSEKPMGKLFTGWPDLPESFWKDYNERKDEFITSVRKEETMDITQQWEDVAKKALALVKKKNMYFRSKSHAELWLMRTFRKNFTTEEWRKIRLILDELCKDDERNLYERTT